MRFKLGSSYNNSDTTCIRVAGRMTVAHGVKERCDRVLRVIVRNPDGVSLDDIIGSLARFGSGETYSRTDVKYAIGRLLGEGYIDYISRDKVYTADEGVAELWRGIEHTYR